jgi:hypothetical protein
MSTVLDDGLSASRMLRAAGSGTATRNGAKLFPACAARMLTGPEVKTE